ncbi:MAG: TIR domain-containing protein [Hyphomicrobium sp.]
MNQIIFMNYRRSDDPGTVGWIYDKLSLEFGETNLFMDVEGKIPIGRDYVERLKEQVALCNVFLAFIGPRWLTASNASGEARLDNSNDWVRIELAAALSAGDDKLVIPVLIGDTQMPQPEQLPEDIRGIVKRQAARVTYARFASDASGLIKQIRQAQAERDRERVASRDRELRIRLEAERLEAQAKLATSKKLSSDELKKAEELASWDFIKERQKPDELRNHIKRFPNSATAQFAAVQLEALVWDACKISGAETDLQAFVDEFSMSPHAVEALALIKSKRDSATAGARYKRAQAGAFWRYIIFSAMAVTAPAAAFIAFELHSTESRFGTGSTIVFCIMLLISWYYSLDTFDDTRASWFNLAIAAVWVALLLPWIVVAFRQSSGSMPALPLPLTNAVLVTLFLASIIFAFCYFIEKSQRVPKWAYAILIAIAVSISHAALTFDGKISKAIEQQVMVVSIGIGINLLAMTAIDWEDDADFHRTASTRFVIASLAAFVVGVFASVGGPWIALAAAASAGALALLVSLPSLYDKAPAKTS